MCSSYAAEIAKAPRMRKAGTAKTGDVVLAVGFGAGLSYAGQAFICP